MWKGYKAGPGQFPWASKNILPLPSAGAESGEPCTIQNLKRIFEKEI